MNKIRIIDLLNKIANKEEIPNKIKYQFKTFELNEEYRYIRVDKVSGYDYGLKTLMDYVLECDLNYEVEIIEEEKEIEKLDENNTNVLTNIIENRKKINELIDAVNELKRGN